MTTTQNPTSFSPTALEARVDARLAVPPAPVGTPDGETPADETDGARPRSRWPLAGAVAGVASLVASMTAMPALDEADYVTGVPVVDKLEAGGYRIAFVCGLVGFGALLATASGWKRWAEDHAPRSLPARLIGQGLTVTATIQVVFACIAGALGLYLPGGAEAGTGMSRDGLFVNFTLLDFGMLLGWWGVALAAVCSAVLAFTTTLLPRWVGVASVLLLLPPVGMALAISLPGFVGLTMPIWLVVTSLGLSFGKRGAAAVA